MNKQNIIDLAEQIRSVGFKNALPCLVRRVCFRPAKFVISRELQKGSEKAIFHFCIKQQNEADSYVLEYYDAVLQKETGFGQEVDGIDIALLDKRMTEIDWIKMFQLGTEEANSVEEEKMWAEAEAIAGIVSDLTKLEKSNDAEAALRLKHKYWTGTVYQEFTGIALSGKVKEEISQRFFLQYDRIISADEAFRFLQNRWLEKELQVKRRREKHSELTTQERTRKHRFSDDANMKRKKSRSISESGK